MKKEPIRKTCQYFSNLDGSGSGTACDGLATKASGYKYCREHYKPSKEEIELERIRSKYPVKSAKVVSKKARPTVNDLETISNDIWEHIHILRDRLRILTMAPERMSELQCRIAQVTHSNLVIAYDELNQVIGAIRSLIQLQED